MEQERIVRYVVAGSDVSGSILAISVHFCGVLE